MEDMDYMRLAVELAKKGAGFVAPNPMVGAVIVKEGEVIGTGYHERFGGLHAERNALAHCTASPKGATLYVTLEPCCHYGKTPPCTDAIIESGIKRVVIGTKDPNPLVAGKGIERLKSRQIKVETGVLETECRELMRIFLHYITTARPYVTVKYAMTMDGKMAAYTGQSRWITGSQARRHVHEERKKYTAVMTGVNTVISDDPLLTCRLEGQEKSRNPIRIVCDTHLRTPVSSQLVQTAGEVQTILATCETEVDKQAAYREAGCEILVTGKQEGHVNLAELMKELGRRRIDSILLEGGGTLNWSAFRHGIVNAVQAYIAPKLFGGSNAPTPLEGAGVGMVKDAIHLTAPKLTAYGEDILLESEVVNPCLRDW